jgi:hypothetical protein
MRAARFLVGMLLAVVTATGAGAGEPAHDARLTSEGQLDPVYGQGIGRVEDGWIVSGTNVLGRLDDGLRETLRVTPAIPPEWAAQGFDHIGDPDVAGGFLYAPLEQPDYDRGRQATARFDLTTLTLVDAVLLPQHHNSFVTVEAGIAYTTDFFDDDTLLRYDVEDGWKPLEPLRLSRGLERIQGGDVAGGAVWLSTDDDNNGVYRVDLETGRVDDVGSAGHLDGEGEGIDATALAGGSLHMLTRDVRVTPVWLGHFEVTGPTPTTGGQAEGRNDTRAASDEVDSSWPPILVAGALALAAGAVLAVFVVIRQARATARDGGKPPG